MKYIQINEQGQFVRNLPNINTFWDDNNFCTPEALIKDGRAGPFFVFEMEETSIPNYDPITQELGPSSAEFIDGIWKQTWSIIDLTQEQILSNQLAKEEQDAKIVEEKIFALWSAADKYTSNYISGVAVGILTIGVLQQLPKAMAVNNWSRSIWTEYYIRKSQVTVSSVDNHDFSSFGPMPHTVPELQEEIGL